VGRMGAGMGSVGDSFGSEKSGVGNVGNTIKSMPGVCVCVCMCVCVCVCVCTCTLV
jgi:hypothetical protein